MSRKSKLTRSACLMLSSTRAAAPSALNMDCSRWVPSRAPRDVALLIVAQALGFQVIQ